MFASGTRFNLRQGSRWNALAELHHIGRQYEVRPALGVKEGSSDSVAEMTRDSARYLLALRDVLSVLALPVHAQADRT